MPPVPAVVALLRGVNVGGHRSFKPTVVAQALRRYDVVNIGAAGTFVVRRPGSRRALRAAFARALPFETVMVLCEEAELRELALVAPFTPGPAQRDIVRFVSFLAEPASKPVTLPLRLPSDGPWLVRLVHSSGRCIVGEYRREMRAIALLGQVDTLFGATATTRNWNTVSQILRVLDGLSPGRALGSRRS